jgi:hypothetical protein
MSDITTHHMGTGMLSPCGLEPASVYFGFQGGFTTDWAEVDCERCLATRNPKDQSFYVTFGVQYRHEAHPFWPGAHPDGWLEVLAPNEEAARLTLRPLIGNRYAFMYEEARFDRKWHPLGRLALVTSDGRIFQSEGVEPPTPQFGPSDCRYYGVDTNEVVAARIEGILKEGGVSDAALELGYEVELVHKSCLTEGVTLFATVHEVDSKVLAGELDYNDPHNCPVCDISIT